MATYRYSEAGIARLLHKSDKLSLIMIGVFLLAMTGVMIAQGLTDPLVLAPFLLVLGGIFFWQNGRKRDQRRGMLASLEIELTEHEIKGTTSTVSTTIAREEITELRYLRDELVVRGRNFGQSLRLTPELEGYDDLVRQIHEWVPAEIPRVQSKRSGNATVLALIFGNLALVVAAVAVTDPIIASILSIAEAVVLLVCIVLVFRLKGVPRKLRLQMAVGFVPVLGLLGRAYVLLSQR